MGILLLGSEILSDALDTRYERVVFVLELSPFNLPFIPHLSSPSASHLFPLPQKQECHLPHSSSILLHHKLSVTTDRTTGKFFPKPPLSSPVSEASYYVLVVDDGAAGYRTGLVVHIRFFLFQSNQMGPALI